MDAAYFSSTFDSLVKQPAGNSVLLRMTLAAAQSGHKAIETIATFPELMKYPIKIPSDIVFLLDYMFDTY